MEAFTSNHSKNTSTNSSEQPEQQHDGKEHPPIDILRNETELLIIVEIPGLTKEEVEVFIEGHQLMIRGNPSALYHQYAYIKQERSLAPFRRIIGLPNRVDPSKVSSFMDQGLLIIKFSLKPSQSRKIIID
ncbi:Hsp20/alpha crystallin family protein [Virgibacillus sp. MG-45]